MMRRAVAICLAALTGCTPSTPTVPATPLDVRVTLGVGQTVDVQRASMRLRFQGVVSDSRCPADAFCIQAGEAVVRIDVESVTGGQATYELHTDTMRSVRHAELTIALIDLSPYPFGTRPIPPAEYRATFGITR